ncbi:hypothetical protein [Paenibacillus sp. V4I7]|uniref:hypothetical protein n=1 Tax=Paenibacillus sp. V4I7 TaxID=3042307 RepID=UPI0027867942|nr:hypothetical protein [Paenibacillus sp. V4I7]MDQ0902938.1 glutamine synthetase adenylyltransferase [Paenibacillus sp. V4I7]
MDELVTELEQRTQQALAELAMMDAERLAEYMEQRGTLMQAIIDATLAVPAQNTMTYKERIQAILGADPIFVQKLTQFRDEAREQLAKIDNGKTQKNAYDNAFDNESYFFDRKK